MDPFTQRMLERASARREKLNTLLSNTGHDVSSRRSPLKEANAILTQVPVITGHIIKSPAKTAGSSSISPKGSPAKTPRRESSPKTPKSEPKRISKENGIESNSSVKSKLQRLGKLYSDDHTGLSSPIHKTEERFAIDDDDIEERKSAKPCARLNRLAALASEIKNWEDDLSHPSIPSSKIPTISKAEKIQAKMNEQVKNVPEPQPSTSGYKKITTNKSGSPKASKWEKTVLETLNLKSSDTKLTKTPEHNKNVTSQSKTEKRSENAKSESTSVRNHNEHIAEKNNSKFLQNTSNTRSNLRNCYNGSPKSSPVKSAGSVMSKASIFESKTSSSKTKDPAEMSLAERKALFERNKGEALIPKAPLTMSVPTKMLHEKEKSSPNQSDIRHRIDTGKAVEAQRSLFEQGTRIQELENNILQSVQAERKRELEMLRSRFNKNKEMMQSAVTSGIRTSESSDGKPISPKNSPICPVKPTPALDQVPPPPPLPKKSTCDNNLIVHNSPVKRQVAGSPPKSPYSSQIKADAKRIKVNAMKSGQLYPDLRNIEHSSTDSEMISETTEAETATCDEQTETETGTEGDYYLQSDNYKDSYSSEYDEDDIANTSLGRSILNAVTNQKSNQMKRSVEPDPDSTTSDISVLDEMDEYLDECLALQESREEGPTPPKINKSIQSPSAPSHSFKYTQGSYLRSPIKIVSPKSSPVKNETRHNENNTNIPLMHSISLYRKQQSELTPKTSSRTLTRDISSEESNSDDDREAILVQDKVKRLLDDIQKQQTIIGQASQALNLCNSTVEFSGSREQVEGERLLLVATHRRQAALNEIQRLKVEGTLKPVVPGSPEVQESGSLTISAITLPLKKDAFRNIDHDTCIHFVALVRHLETVIATPVIQAQNGDYRVTFPSTLKLEDLYSDFKITIEVYSLQTRAEILPHEVKYHIHNNGSAGSSNSSAKKIITKTPKKLLKQESKLIMPSVQSPAGPGAVRTSNFSLSGYVVFSLKEVQRQQFTLNKVPVSSPLEGCLRMHVSCELTVSVDHSGFLTMFEDVSGFGAWHRRWCLLKGATLSYWKYPDDEKKKTPLGSIDLQTVSTKNVGLVSRDICARPNTFLLETIRPAQPNDCDSLVMLKNGSETTIRHLLSADTKEDRLEWCSKLNKTLNLIRAWGSASS